VELLWFVVLFFGGGFGMIVVDFVLELFGIDLGWVCCGV